MQADNLGSKVSAAQQSVLDALAHVEKMQTETRNTDSGRRLEVNENILGLTFKLEKHMQSLIEAANAMRAGLEETKGERWPAGSVHRLAVTSASFADDETDVLLFSFFFFLFFLLLFLFLFLFLCSLPPPGTQSDDEFNAKHEKWFEGLSQAVDSMVEGNPILTEALRSVVRKKGKHEELQVSARCVGRGVGRPGARGSSPLFFLTPAALSRPFLPHARNISAAVAQLAALSRTKTLRDGDTSLSRVSGGRETALMAPEARLRCLTRRASLARPPPAESPHGGGEECRA